MRRLVFPAVALAVALALLPLAQRPAAGSVTSSATTATLSFAMTSPVLSEVHGTWTTTVLVQDAGVRAPTFVFGLAVTTAGDPDFTKGKAVVTPVPPKGCALQAGEVSTVTIRFDKRFPVVPTAAVLLVEATGPTTVIAGPTTEALVVRRAIGLFGEVLAPLLVGLAAALLFIVVTWSILPGRRAGRRRRGGRRERRSATASSTWSFKDSWATNVTAAGAVFGAVLTATGTITSAFPGVPLYRYALLNAAYAGIATVGPVVVGLGAVPHGTDQIKVGEASLLCAGGLTLLALGGELTSLATLEWWSSAVPWARIVLVVATGLVGALLLVYAILATASLFYPLSPTPARGTEHDRAVAASEGGAAGRPTYSLRERAQEFAFNAPIERSASI